MTCLLGMCVCTVFSTSVFLNFGCVFEFGSTLFLAQLWFAVLVVVVVVLFWLNFVFNVHVVLSTSAFVELHRFDCFL